MTAKNIAIPLNLRALIFRYAIIVRNLFALCLLTAAPVLAANLNLAVKKSEQGDISKKKKVINWIQNRHSPKHLGMDDPDLPSFVQYKPLMIPLPWGYRVPKAFLVRDDYLDMRSLTPQVLENLETTELKNLLEYLASVPVEIKWSNQKGHTQSGRKLKHRAHNLKQWEESNAAAALALTMGVQSQSQLFASMISLVPHAIVPEFHGHMSGLINAKITARVVANMLGQLEQGTSASLARVICSLIEQGLSYWVRKDVTKLDPYLSDLLLETVKIIETNKPQSKEAVLGLLLGSVLAGTMNHVDAIKKTDEKRIWVVGVVSNLVWAATAFIACVPFATPFAAATAGTISIGAVLSTTIYAALDFPRNFSPSVKDIEGNLEIAALESTRFQGIDDQINMLLMLSWMRAAVHVNGLND